MRPLDVTPIRTDPATLSDTLRRKAHTRRCETQHAADAARSEAMDAMTRNGIAPPDAAKLLDALIVAVRIADADRLEYARAIIREEDSWWPGVGDMNGAVDFLRVTAHAYPVLDAD